MGFSSSIMSYNLRHHTHHFEEAEQAGILPPEDIRALALNKRAFADLQFNPEKDIPEGYHMPSRIVYMGPMGLPGHFPYGIKATTPSGETFGSSISHVGIGEIKASTGPGITFDARTMWHSLTLTNTWASFDIELPMDVTLDRMVAHTQHSGICHAAEAIRIHAGRGEEFSEVGAFVLSSVDATVDFSATRAKKWRFALKPGDSGAVVVRGLEFFYEQRAVFPPMIPYVGKMEE